MPDKIICPHCKNDDLTLIEKYIPKKYEKDNPDKYLCNVCSKEFVLSGKG